MIDLIIVGCLHYSRLVAHMYGTIVKEGTWDGFLNVVTR